MKKYLVVILALDGNYHYKSFDSKDFDSCVKEVKKFYSALYISFDLISIVLNVAV